MPSLSKKSLPCSVGFLYSVWSTQSRNGNHGWSSVNMSHSEVSEPCHRSMYCTRCQMSTQLPVIRIGWNCSDHVRRVDVFKGAHDESIGVDRFGLSFTFLKCLELLIIFLSLLSCPFITVFGDSLFQEISNILNKNMVTGNLTLLEASLTPPYFSCFTSLAASPAPSATTITRCFFILSCW